VNAAPLRKKIGRVAYWPVHIQVRRDGIREITWGPMPGQGKAGDEEDAKLL
jgi:hypothetical protein